MRTAICGYSDLSHGLVGEKGVPFVSVCHDWGLPMGLWDAVLGWVLLQSIVLDLGLQHWC